MLTPTLLPTCSSPPSFWASFTLPMLPAPMVFPRTHFPDCVGIVVRVRLWRPWAWAAWLAWAAWAAWAVRPSAGAATGPPLLAAVLFARGSMSAVATYGDGAVVAVVFDRLLSRRCGRVDAESFLARVCGRSDRSLDDEYCWATPAVS